MMLAALALAGILAGQDAPSTVSPTTITGAAPSPDCGGLRELAAGGDLPMRCVTAPLEQVGAMALSYAAEARRQGWAVLRGDNNVLWMQKPGAGATCERMTVVIFWDSRQHPEPRAGIPGYVGVITQAEQACEPLPATPAPTTAP